MSEYTMIVENMECDLYRQLPPKQILEHCISMTLIDMKADGCDGPALESGCGAVWMASHARIFQYAPIVSGDALTYRTFPRVIEGNRYIYYVEIRRGDELVVRFDASYIPVDRETRHVLRLSEVEPLWRTPSRSAPATIMNSSGIPIVTRWRIPPFLRPFPTCATKSAARNSLR